MKTLQRLAHTLILGAALLITGCASESYVNDRDAALDARITRVESNLSTYRAAQDSKEDSWGIRLNKAESGLADTSRAAQEALERAHAAHKLASGKLLYEVTLADSLIHFSSSKTKLNKEAVQALNELVTKLKSDNHNIYIEIQGHTDSNGPPALNKQLGLARAESVRDALHEAGVPLHRMNVISYGSSQPAVKGNNAKARAQNRRVMLMVLA